MRSGGESERQVTSRRVAVVTQRRLGSLGFALPILLKWRRRRVTTSGQLSSISTGHDTRQQGDEKRRRTSSLEDALERPLGTFSVGKLGRH